MEYIWIIAIIGIIVLFAYFFYQNHSVKNFIENAKKISFGMTKEEVFSLLNNQEPREITRNQSKETERYRWSIGQNTYSRTYVKGTSFGSSNHGRRHVTVVFKDNKVIEVDIK